MEKPKKKGQKPEINWYYDRDDPEEALIVLESEIKKLATRLSGLVS